MNRTDRTLPLDRAIPGTGERWQCEFLGHQSDPGAYVPPLRMNRAYRRYLAGKEDINGHYLECGPAS